MSQAADRKKKILDLKKKIVGIYGSTLLPSSINQVSLEVIRKDDSEEVRAEKLEENRNIIAERDAAYKQREPELVYELDKIIDRIRMARSEYGSIDMLYSSGTAAIPVPKFICTQCGNKNPDNIISDPLRGDSICMGSDGAGCGAVILDHAVIQGAEKRNFEGEEDRNHFGPAPNRLMPDVVNMETNLNIFMSSGKDNSAWKRLAQAQQTVEMNLSCIGKEDERHTRQGYKTKQKRQAFALMEEIAANINIHQLVVTRAKEEFTKFRDVREALHQFEGVVAACLVLSYEELSLELRLDEVRQQNIHPNYLSVDVGKQTTSKFGIISPRSEITHDTAICTVPQIPMGRFDLTQVHTWLFAVSSSSNATTTTTMNKNALTNNVVSSSELEAEAATFIFDHIAQLMQSQQRRETNTQASSLLSSTSDNMSVTDNNTANVTDTSSSSSRRKPLPKSTIFGTVTVSSRLNRYKPISSNNNCNTNPSSPSGTAAATANDITSLLTRSNRRSSSHNNLTNIVSHRKETYESVLTAGQLLLKANFSDILSNATSTSSSSDKYNNMDISIATGTSSSRFAAAAVDKLFHEAVVRRSQYDALCYESDRLKGMQTKRLRIEDLSNTSMLHTGNALKGDAASGSSSLTTAGLQRYNNSSLHDDRTKRTRVESTYTRSKDDAKLSASNAVSNSGSNAIIQVEEEEGEDQCGGGEYDFDLEDLVGGPVLSMKDYKQHQSQIANNVKNIVATTSNSFSVDTVTTTDLNTSSTTINNCSVSMLIDHMGYSVDNTDNLTAVKESSNRVMGVISHMKGNDSNEVKQENQSMPIMQSQFMTPNVNTAAPPYSFNEEEGNVLRESPVNAVAATASSSSTTVGVAAGNILTKKVGMRPRPRIVIT